MPRHYSKAKRHGNSKYSAQEVGAWRRKMCENKWTQVQLADHLGKGVNLVGKLLRAEAYGELPNG